MSLILTVEVGKGHIVNHIAQAKQICSLLGVEVKFKHEGIEMHIKHEDQFNDVLRDFEQRRELLKLIN